jgi:hypothetical protein
MESLPLFVQGKSMSLIGNQAHPLHWIAAEDYAAEWAGTATLMRHYERWGEDGSPDEANHLLGAPTIRIQEWCDKKKVIPE